MMINTDLKMIARSKLFPIFAIAILIISCAIGVVSYYNSSEVLKKYIIQSMVWRTQDNADLIGEHLKEFKTIVEGIVLSDKIQSMDWNIQRTVLDNEVRRLNVKRFLVAELNGHAHSTDGSTIDVSDREWFKKAQQGITYMTEPYHGRIDKEIIMSCGIPIKNTGGQIVGVLGTTLDPQILYNLIRKIKVGKTGYGYIINNNGIMIAHPDSNLVLSEGYINKKEDANQHFVIREQGMVSGQRGFKLYMYRGVEKYATYSPIPDTEWLLVLTAPTNEVFSDINVLKVKFIFITLFIMTICMVSCIFVIGYILEKRRIGDLEKRVEEDERLLRESVELEKIRIQFFANISHEFRTPLNVILSSLQLFKLYFEKEKAFQTTNISKHLRVMKQNCFRLLRLVNNLIDTTRIDAGFLESHKQNHNIVSIIEDITMSVVEYAKDKGIRILFDTDTEEKIIACDLEMIERIMLNLLSNAIKFTDVDGIIFVTIFDKGESIVVAVRDTGIGIPKDKQTLIFERFVQVEQTLTRNHEGSGIGLSMVKSFIEMHGGKITVLSECGEGSEFIIELPATVLKSEEETVPLSELQVQQMIQKIEIEFSDINN